MKISRPLLIPLLIFLTGTGFAAYKWIDDEGNTVYSQTLPPGVKEAGEVKKPPPPPVAPEVANQQLQEMRQRLEDSREDRQLKADAEAEEAEAKRLREQNCRSARSNLTALQGSTRTLFGDGEGNYQRLDEQERQSKISKQQEIIARDCEP